MVRYPVRPWWHPLQMMASNPAGYTWGVFSIGLILAYPFRHRIARYHERQRDTMANPPRALAVRYYKHLDSMMKREILYKQPFVNEEQPYARIGQSVSNTSFMFGIVDSELDYWSSHQRDMQRAAKLTDELREIKARMIAEGTAEA